MLTAAEEPATLLETGEGATKLLVAVFTDEIGTENVLQMTKLARMTYPASLTVKE